MSTQMSHFVKKSNRKTMLLNGATSTRMADVGDKTRKSVDSIEKSSSTVIFSNIICHQQRHQKIFRRIDIFETSFL